MKPSTRLCGVESSNPCIHWSDFHGCHAGHTEFCGGEE